MRHQKQTNQTANERRAAVDPRLPVYYVTGSNDATRTAALRRLCDGGCAGLALVLGEPHSWHQISADAGVISQMPAIARKPGGGFCADAVADPVHALYQLHLRRLGLLEPSIRYDAVVFEVGSDIATGSLLAIVQNDTRLDVTYRIAGIIHVVNMSEQPFRSHVEQTDRIGEADTVILMQTPVAEPGEIQDAIAAIGSVNPFADVLLGDAFSRDDLRDRTLMSAHADHDQEHHPAHKCTMVGLPRTSPEVQAAASNIFNDPYVNQTESKPVRALKVRLQGEVDLPAVMALVEGLCTTYGSDLLRLDAVLSVRHADHPIVLHVIGGKLLHPAYYPDFPRSISEICVLGNGLDVRSVSEALGRCGRNRNLQQADLRAAI